MPTRVTLKVSRRTVDGAKHEWQLVGQIEDDREFPSVKDLWELERAINEDGAGLRAHIELDDVIEDGK